MSRLVTTGELLVDMAPVMSGNGGLTGQAYLPQAGGAPANVAVGAARLGAPAAFLGKVGDDLFGRALARTLSEAGVDVSGLRFDTGARTALAFVSLGEGGERDFTFYRHPAADMLYRPDEVDLAVAGSAGILHFGSISLIAEPSRSATMAAIAAAEAGGALLSFDPNLRPALWPDMDAARSAIQAALERAAIVKLAAEELEFLTGSRDDAAAASLFRPMTRLIVITEGPRQTRYFTRGASGSVPAFEVEPIDTTGAGDAFAAALLTRLLASPALVDDEYGLAEAIRWANAAAALVVTRSGAIPAMPSAREIDRLLAEPPAEA